MIYIPEVFFFFLFSQHLDVVLTLCTLGNFSCFWCRRLTSFKKYFFSLKHLSGTLYIRESNGLDLDQDRRFVGPDLDPNRLQQRLSADDKSHC